MKNLFLLIGMLLLGNLVTAQQCIYVDSVYNTAKLRELGNRDIRFGIRQIVEEELSEKYCLSESGDDIDVEVYYFGLPQGIGESDTEIRAIMIEVQEGAIPFEKMTVSSALKKAIHEAAIKLP